MKSRTKSLGLALLGAGLSALGINCAPTAGPEPDRARPQAEGPPAEQLTFVPKPTEDGLGPRIENVVEHVRRRDLDTTNSFWTIFHGILGLGPDLQLIDRDSGQRVNALQTICEGKKPIRGLRLIGTPFGADVELNPPRLGVGVGQGHQDQYIAEMAQWGIAPDHKFMVDGKECTYLDFVRHSQMRARVKAGQELSWAILVIGQYISTEARWTNGAGESLKFEDLIRAELDAAVEEAPCGGTHRLFGLSWAAHLHAQRGLPMTGIWQEVLDKTKKYAEKARQAQNPDGSFSTEFFRGPGNRADKQARISTTGHTLEWLALALPRSELQKPWVQNAVNAMTTMILDLEDAPIESGSLYHAVHGLLIYHTRLYNPGPPTGKRPLVIPPPGEEAPPKVVPVALEAKQ